MDELSKFSQYATDSSLSNPAFDEVEQAVDEVKGEITKEAVGLVKNARLIKRHANVLKNISDRALAAETEKQELKVLDRKAKNRAERQEIKNRLIALKTEATKLKREKKQVLKDQKAEYKKRNKDALWEIYKDKLEKMKYSYVPNKFVLKMLLFFDGVVSFINGLGAVSTAIVKALKWVFAILLIAGVLMAFPQSREWLFSLFM